MHISIMVSHAFSSDWRTNWMAIPLAEGASAGSLRFWAVLLPAVIAVGWCVRGLRTLRGTTVTAPCTWALFSLTAIVAAEWLLGRPTEAQPSAVTIRYLAATTTLCPVMGLLGAKRPQDRGWQFIVLTLWIVLILPAAQHLAFAPGVPLQLHPAWQAFLGLLVLTGLTNHLPTRYGFSALLASASQSILFWGRVPGVGTTAGRPAVVVALSGLALALTLVGLDWPARRRARNGWDRVWLDFRDTFGVVWGLRVAERVNDTARRSHGDARLHWNGFHREPAAATAESTAPETAVQIALQNQLRRFVSPDWLDARRSPPR